MRMSTNPLNASNISNFRDLKIEQIEGVKPKLGLEFDSTDSTFDAAFAAIFKYGEYQER